MSRNYRGKTIAVLLALSLLSCRHSAEKHAPLNRKQLEADSIPELPLKPAGERILADVPAIYPQSGTRIFSVPIQGAVSFDARRQQSIASRVAGRIERMNIKYNYQPVQKGQLIMEIYSPELAAAQQDLIYISRHDNDKNLLQKAKERLLLLGMQPGQISQVLRSGKPIYRMPVYSAASGYILEKEGVGIGNENTPAAGSMRQSPVLTREGQYVGAGETIFTIYKTSALVADFYLEPWLAALVKKGEKLVYHPVSDSNHFYTARIGLLEPSLRSGAPFTIARVYLNDSGLQPGQLLQAQIPVVKTGATWLPDKAVLQLGQKQVVFKKEGDAFVAEEVTTGIRAGGVIEITSDIADWQVAENAGLLTDSEGFIKTGSNK